MGVAVPTEVSSAMHPAAGRMAGHMNVLLAGASLPYESLQEMEQANELSFDPRTTMVFGDAKESRSALGHAVKDA